MKAEKLLDRMHRVSNVTEALDQVITFDSDAEFQDFWRASSRMLRVTSSTKGSKGYFRRKKGSSIEFMLAEVVQHTEGRLAYNRGDVEQPAKVTLKLSTGETVDAEVNSSFLFYEPLTFSKAYQQFAQSAAQQKKLEKESTELAKKLFKKVSSIKMVNRTFETKHPTMGTRKWKVSSDLKIDGNVIVFTLDTEEVGKKRSPMNVPQVIRYASFEEGQVKRWYGTHPPKSVQDWVQMSMRTITPDQMVREIKDILKVAAEEDRESYWKLFDNN